ncbi:MAG: tRNA 2-thiouridine(34) synthase MnmA [Dehalococcoidales bacterium]|nr:tRNA 2-thiouridine(34) synthase MnmA [Dehalococcoidales bacterium]
MTAKRVAVAMSGGVDSSIAACLLKNQGYDVFGVTMLLVPYGNKAVDNAKQVTERLNIPHHVIDLSELFNERIIKPFCNEYSLGRTPNPCITCNYHIKFGALLDKAREMGADLLATGHYARIDKTAGGFRLLKGVDRTKDQSYFLYMLGQEQLEHILLPLGNLTKAEVKKTARELGLDSAVRHESQDICFIPRKDRDTFIRENIETQSGDIIDSGGKVIGKHKGLAYYTIGQRQGLRLASSGRRYIIKIEAVNNRVTLGTREQIFSKRLIANKLSWVSGIAPDVDNGITTKVRYKAPEAAVNLSLHDNYCKVEFEEPQWAVTPGQSIVFYLGEEVLGGGIIEDPEFLKRNDLLDNSL